MWLLRHVLGKQQHGIMTTIQMNKSILKLLNLKKNFLQNVTRFLTKFKLAFMYHINFRNRYKIIPPSIK